MFLHTYTCFFRKIQVSAIFLLLNEQCTSQIREQMSGPDLYVLTVGFLALKKTSFSEKKNSSQKKKNFFFSFLQCNFSGRTLQFFQKIFFFFFCPQKVEKITPKSCILSAFGSF